MILMRISSAPVEQVEPHGSKEILDFADLKASPHPRRPAFCPLSPSRPQGGAFISVWSGDDLRHCDG